MTMHHRANPIHWALAGQVMIILTLLAMAAFGPIAGALVGTAASVLVGVQAGRAARAIREDEAGNEKGARHP